MGAGSSLLLLIVCAAMCVPKILLELFTRRKRTQYTMLVGPRPALVQAKGKKFVISNTEKIAFLKQIPKISGLSLRKNNICEFMWKSSVVDGEIHTESNIPDISVSEDRSAHDVWEERISLEPSRTFAEYFFLLQHECCVVRSSIESVVEFYWDELCVLSQYSHSLAILMCFVSFFIRKKESISKTHSSWSKFSHRNWVCLPAWREIDKKRAKFFWMKFEK